MSYEKAAFRLEGIDGEFEGYTDGRIWAGYACPVFEKDVADRLVSATSVDAFEQKYGVLKANDRTGAYDLYKNGRDIVDSFKPIELECADGQKRVLFDVGYANWPWVVAE